MADSARYVLRVEGVNFDQTVLDTNNLSVLRGGSLALLTAADEVEARLTAVDASPKASSVLTLFKGASQAAFKLELDSTQVEALRADMIRATRGDYSRAAETAAVLKHMRVMVDIAEINGDDTGALVRALETAQAKNRKRQMQELTVPIPTVDSSVYVKSGKRPCPVDHVRPIGGIMQTEPDRWPNHKLDTATQVGVSASVADRVAFGMQRGREKRRENFFRLDIGIPEPIITNHFDELVTFSDPGASSQKAPPSFLQDLPKSVQSKMAVIYADGNGFTDIIRRYSAEVYKGDSAQALHDFSVQVKKQREHLECQLVDRMKKRVRRAIDPANPAVSSEDVVSDKLHMETILWGADEMMWVVPAWTAWDFLGDILEITKDWRLTDRSGAPLDAFKLTHAIGVLTCDFKTPIQQASALAKNLGDQAKGGMKKYVKEEAERSGHHHPTLANAFQIENLESIDLPKNYLNRHREAVFGVKTDTQATVFTMMGDAYFDITKNVKALKRTVPRSQLYRLLRIAVRTNAFHEPSELVEKELKAAAERQSGGPNDQWEPKDLETWAGPCFGVGIPQQPPVSQPLPLRLAMLAQVWDYIDPLDRGADGGHES